MSQNATDLRSVSQSSVRFFNSILQHTLSRAQHGDGQDLTCFSQVSELLVIF